MSVRPPTSEPAQPAAATGFRAHLDQTPQDLLVELLCDMFDIAELRHFIGRGTDTTALLAALPGPRASLVELADAFVGAADRHGLLTPSFFDRLAAVRPRRSHEVAAVGRCFAHLHEQSRTDLASASSAGPPWVKKEWFSLRLKVGRLMIVVALSVGAFLWSLAHFRPTEPAPTFLLQVTDRTERLLREASEGADDTADPPFTEPPPTRSVESPPAEPTPGVGTTAASPAIGGGPSSGQELSAQAFRMVLLRSSQSRAVRTCYRRHARPGQEEVELTMIVSPDGRAKKIQLEPAIPLAECLRGVVRSLRFPAAIRSAQHYFTFRDLFDEAP